MRLDWHGSMTENKGKLWCFGVFLVFDILLYQRY